MRPHHHDAIGQNHCLFDVVGDNDEGSSMPLPEREDMILQLDAGEGIKRRKGLVEQQQMRFGRERTSDGDPLRLTAREFFRPKPDSRISSSNSATRALRTAAGNSRMPKAMFSATVSQGNSRGS